MSRYWLVKSPEGDIAETVCRLLESCRGKPNAMGVEVVEIKPERRDSNWMEVEIAKKYAKGELP